MCSRIIRANLRKQLWDGIVREGKPLKLQEGRWFDVSVDEKGDVQFWGDSQSSIPVNGKPPGWIGRLKITRDGPMICSVEDPFRPDDLTLEGTPDLVHLWLGRDALTTNPVLVEIEDDLQSVAPTLEVADNPISQPSLAANGPILPTPTLIPEWDPEWGPDPFLTDVSGDVGGGVAMPEGPLGVGFLLW